MISIHFFRDFSPAVLFWDDFFPEADSISGIFFGKNGEFFRKNAEIQGEHAVFLVKIM